MQHHVTGTHSPHFSSGEGPYCTLAAAPAGTLNLPIHLPSAFVNIAGQVRQALEGCVIAALKHAKYINQCIQFLVLVELANVEQHHPDTSKSVKHCIGKAELASLLATHFAPASGKQSNGMPAA